MEIPCGQHCTNENQQKNTHRGCLHPFIATIILITCAKQATTRIAQQLWATHNAFAANVAVNWKVTPKQACFQNQPERATCVQNTFESRDAAIHNAYHTSLRPSSFFEPRHPSLKELKQVLHAQRSQGTSSVLVRQLTGSESWLQASNVFPTVLLLKLHFTCSRELQFSKPANTCCCA